MSRNATGTVARRITHFLVAFRWMALLLGMSLTWYNGRQPRLTYTAFDASFLIGLVVFVYHIFGSVLAYKAQLSKKTAGVLMTGDVLAGCLITFTYGVDYMLLGFTLPVLEAAYFLPFFNTAIIGILVSVFHVPVLLTVVFKVANIDGDLARLRGESLLSGMVITLLAAWNMSIIQGVRDEGDKVGRQHQEDKNLLLEQLHINKKDIQELVNQLNAREDSTRDLERELKEVRDDLEGTLRKLHECRKQYQSAQQLALRKETEWAANEEQKERELQEQLDAVQREAGLRELLLEQMHRLSAHLHRDNVIMAMIECLNQLLASQTCLIFAVEHQDGREELLPDGGASPYLDFVRNLSIAPGEGPVGWVAQQRTTLSIENSQIAGNDELSTLFSNERSALVVPLIADERSLGVIYLGRPQPKAFTPQDQALLESFALLASPIFNNALIYHRTLTTGLYDEVTGLYNGAYFDERLTEEVRRAHRYNRSISLILIDLDNFTRFNEQVGHAEGNRTLRDFADMLREHVRETDVVARLEGDEFALLLVESDKSNAILIGERIRGAFEMRHMARRVSISLSGGLAVLPTECKTRDQLVARASQALQAAQKKPGNHIVY